jgi:hypothetical protein
MRNFRRRATIILHWTLFVLIVPLGGGWVTTGMEWVFAVCALLMAALALGFGLQAYAGPRSPWVVRLINAWGHRGLYVYVAVIGAMAIRHLLTGTGNMVIHYQILLWITIFHAIYHLWRQLVAGDHALRTMAPRSIHSML